MTKDLLMNTYFRMDTLQPYNELAILKILIENIYLISKDKLKVYFKINIVYPSSMHCH